MKKTFQFLVVLFMMHISTNVFSQSIAIKAGLNVCTPYYKSNYIDKFDNIITYYGVNAGIFVEFPLNDMFLIETGMVYSLKGLENNFIENIEGYHEINIIELSYLDIPIAGKMRHKVGGFSIAVSAGVFLSMGLSGTSRMEVFTDSPFGKIKHITENDVKWGDDKFDYKIFDFGSIFGIEFEFHSIILGVAYCYGLENIVYPNKYTSTYKHRVTQITLGYKWSNL